MMPLRIRATLLLIGLGWIEPALSADLGGAAQLQKLDWIRPSPDKSHFILSQSKERFSIWGFNYDRDDAGRLLEDYWADEWPTVVEDFREMKALGANVVRIHLQFHRFMAAPDRPDAANLDRLKKLVNLAEALNLYLDITGLGRY